MAEPILRTTRHTITVAAPPERVYALVADVTRWPQIFGPSIHVERVSGDLTQEQIRIWALANGEVRHWTSRRELDAAAMTVGFRQEISSHPVARMGGEWQVLPHEGGTRVVLLHDYRIVGDVESDAAWVEQAIERNSQAELTALRATAELGDIEDLWLSFDDSVEVDGDVDSVYQFLARAHEWPDRLPHVSRLDLDEEVPDVQHMTMDTRGPDGSVHTTVSVRVCFPTSHIVYKQTQVPAIMSAHTGRWTFTEEDGVVRATSQHTVVLKPSAIEGLLGPDATIADARAAVRKALGGNSLTTLRHAKAFAEARKPERVA